MPFHRSIPRTICYSVRARRSWRGCARTHAQIGRNTAPEPPPSVQPHQVFAIRTTAIKGNRTALGLDEDGFEGSFRKVSPQLLGSRMENPIDILDRAAPGRIGGRSDVQRMVGCMDYRTRHGEIRRNRQASPCPRQASATHLRHGHDGVGSEALVVGGDQNHPLSSYRNASYARDAGNPCSRRPPNRFLHIASTVCDEDFPSSYSTPCLAGENCNISHPRACDLHLQVRLDDFRQFAGIGLVKTLQRKSTANVVVSSDGTEVKEFSCKRPRGCLLTCCANTRLRSHGRPTPPSATCGIG